MEMIIKLLTFIVQFIWSIFFVLWFAIGYLFGSFKSTREAQELFDKAMDTVWGNY